MSYDYQPDKANSYQEEHGYVHVGYKTLIQFGNTLMPWKPFQMANRTHVVSHHDIAIHQNGQQRLLAERFGIFVQENMHNMTFTVEQNMLNAALAIAAASPSDIITSFPPRQIVEDSGRGERQGFHVAATREQAMGLEPGFGQATPKPARPVNKVKRVPASVYRWIPNHFAPNNMDKDVEFYTEYELPKPLVLVRCLMPEHALTYDGKCVRYKAIMVIPPGEKETPADIAACDAWNARHKPRTPLVPDPTDPILNYLSKPKGTPA